MQTYKDYSLSIWQEPPIYLPKLQWRYSEADTVLSYLGHSADGAGDATVFRQVGGTTQWTLHLRLATVDGYVGGRTHSEGIVFIILKGDLIHWVLLTNL